MLSKLFFGGKQGTQVSSPIETLKQTLSTLEEKKLALQKKISLEVEGQRNFRGQKTNKCLKRKKCYEDQLKNLGTYQVLLRNQDGMRCIRDRKQKLSV